MPDFHVDVPLTAPAVSIGSSGKKSAHNYIDRTTGDETLA